MGDEENREQNSYKDGKNRNQVLIPFLGGITFSSDLIGSGGVRLFR